MNEIKRCPECNGKMILQKSFYTFNGTKYQYSKCKRCKKEVKILEIKYGEIGW